jgi:ABC-type nitrate/sulfonate/bicarbonate transport system substrate-binding protein
MGGLKRQLGLMLTALSVIVLSAVSICSWSCYPAGDSAPASIRVGTSLLEPCIPILIAAERQYFAQNGLNATMKFYDSGLSQVNGMLQGEVDMAGSVAEYILVGKAFKKEKIMTFGTIDKAENVFIVARRDRQISSFSDLKSKRIGVVLGTITEFYLGRSLELNGINIKDVTFVNMASFSSASQAVVAGDVDACIALVPFIEDAKSKLGDDGLMWPGQSGQAIYSLLLCPDEWVNKQPLLIEKFLFSIRQAEDFIIEHPVEAKALVSKRLNYSEDYVDKIWTRNLFSLSLTQSVITAMEDEARWMITNKLTAENKVPDFVKYIYVDGLEKVKPGTVDIIR